MCSHGDVVMVKVPSSIEIRYNRPEYDLRKVVMLDRCIVDEVTGLWEEGIHTTGCCCGHNKIKGYIGVIPEDIDRMKAMGYRVHFNHCRPNDEDSFQPKTIIELQYQEISEI